MHRFTFLSSFFILILLLSSCSWLGGKNYRNKENKVSQYDLEFDKDKKTSSQQSEVSEEEELLARAMDSYERGVFSIAKNAFLNLQKQYPNSYFLPLVELKIADCDFYLGKYTEAIEAYEEFLRVRPTSEAAAYAAYKIAEAHIKKYRGPFKDQTPLKTALEKLKDLSENYGNSEYQRLAERATKEAKQKLAEHDLIVAKFYAKQGMHKAALNRLVKLFQRYPKSTPAQMPPEELRKTFKLNDAEIVKLIPEASQTPSPVKRKSRSIMSQSEKVRAMMGTSNSSQSMTKSNANPSSPRTRRNESLAYIPAISLSCEEQEKFLIVQAQLPEDLSLSNSASSASLSTLILSSDKLNSASNTSPILDSCELSEVYAQAFIKDSQVIIEIRGIEGRSAELIELNRPNRLALVIRK